MPELASLAEVDEIDMDFRSILGVSARMQRLYAGLAPRTRLAIYAPGDLAFGMARMFQSAAALGAALEVGVFREREDAQGWLFDRSVFRSGRRSCAT